MKLYTALTVALAMTLAACGSSNSAPAPTITPPPGDVPSSSYDVTVTRTAMGIPHVKANDWGSMGYGLGYAFAEDNLCVLLEDMLTIRGERAKYFGRNGPTYTLTGHRHHGAEY